MYRPSASRNPSSGSSTHGPGYRLARAQPVRPATSRSWQSRDSLHRLAQHAPGLVSLLLAALIVAECWSGVLSLMSAQPPLAVDRMNEHHRSAQLDEQTILTAHLFGVAENAIPGSEPAPLKMDNLLLEGTVTTQSPSRGIAIISDTGAAKVLQVGDEIGGATLRFVYLDHVNLNYGGQWITLALPLLRSSIKRSTAGDEGLPISDDDSAQGISALGEAISARASVDVSQQLRGFIIKPGNVRHAFFKFGLHEQDLVISVNGATVADEDRERSQKILDTMLNSSQGVITVMRAGVSQDIVLDASLAGSRIPSR
jgi:type II secretion system protein C